MDDRLDYPAWTRRQVVPAQALMVPIPASKDNTLYEDRRGRLSNGGGTHFFVGVTDTGNIRRGLIAFNIAGAIPAGALITSVSLKLHMSQTIAGSQNITLHRVLADWGEGDSNAPGEEGGGTARFWLGVDGGGDGRSGQGAKLEAGLTVVCAR